MDQLPLSLTWAGDHWLGAFPAMASPCQLLIEPCSQQQAQGLLHAAYQIATELENKYSRYKQGNLCYQINHSRGRPVAIDDETYRLFTFAEICYQLSDGMFDITSGVLRKAWHFDTSDNLPEAEKIKKLLPHIGWKKITVTQGSVTVPDGMEVDFGGIVKEYAADKVAARLAVVAPALSVLVNFGGDLALSRERQNGAGWQVGLELKQNVDQARPQVIELTQGGLATSGDANRYLLKDGIRYSHILNPKTGWPVAQAPAQVTVAGVNCVQAGMLSTMALLHGAGAKAFLDQQGVSYWIID